MDTRRIGGLAGMLGPIAFVAVFLVEGWIRPDYNPLHDYVSALAMGGRGWIQIANFIVVGVCLLLFALGVAREFPKGAASRAGPILLTILGLGYLLSGPFVMDPAGTAAAALSPHGLTHGILGAIVFVLMPVIGFVFVRRFAREPAWRWLLWPTVLLASFIAIADIAFSAVTKSPDLVTASVAWGGLLQRLVIVPFMLWIAIFALGLYRRAAA